jgi:2,3-bisphosphoglycerate-dependent phosphoglycerate mutase
MNKKNLILLVRHGESVWNHDSKFTGWTNIPLTQKGRNEAIKIANTLSINKLIPNIIFSSVLERCIDTSNIIKNTLNLDQAQIHTTWRLNEKHYGTLEGIPRQHIRDIYGDLFTKMMRSNFYMKPPIIKDYSNNHVYSIYRNCYLNKLSNGESKQDVLNRLIPYYENDILYTLSENKIPLIVTHKHTARVLMKHLLNIPDEDFENYQIPSKKILAIEINDNFNYIKHDEISYK